MSGYPAREDSVCFASRPPAAERFLDRHLPRALLALSGALLVVWLWVDAPSTGVVLCVLLPIGILWMLLFPAAMLPLWERRCGSCIGQHRSFVLSVASAGMGGVLVAVTVMLGVVDAPVWKALTEVDQLVPLLVAPTFTWFGVLSVSVWGFVTYGVYAASSWPALRRTAAAVSFAAAIALPLLMPLVAYQMWRLVDANIAGG